MDNTEKKIEFATGDDVMRMVDETPPEQREECGYRRGYRDGWVQAVNAIGYLVSKKRGSKPMTMSSALDMAYDHWNGPLFGWLHGDKSKFELPPRMAE